MKNKLWLSWALLLTSLISPLQAYWEPKQVAENARSQVQMVVGQPLQIELEPKDAVYKVTVRGWVECWVSKKPVNSFNGPWNSSQCDIRNWWNLYHRYPLGTTPEYQVTPDGSTISTYSEQPWTWQLAKVDN